MGETIVYSDDKGVSTTDDMRKIASYLGVSAEFISRIRKKNKSS